MGVTHAQENCLRNLYQKLTSMHVTKIVRFDWSAVFRSTVVSRTRKLHRVELRSIRCKFLVEVSCPSFSTCVIHISQDKTRLTNAKNCATFT